MTKTITLAVALATLSFVTTQAQTIADWTFETSQPQVVTNFAGPYSPEIGSGSAYGVHSYPAVVFNSPVGNGSAHSFSATNWAVGDYWQFDVSTLGYSGVTISWDQTSSSTGPGVFGLFYSINGGAYTQIGVNYTVLADASPNPAWNSTTRSSIYTYTPNLSSLGGILGNQTSVSFELIDETSTNASGGPNSTGTDSIDNFLVAAPVPEPTAVSLALLGSLVSVAALRRRK